MTLYSLWYQSLVTANRVIYFLNYLNWNGSLRGIVKLIILLVFTRTRSNVVKYIETRIIYYRSQCIISGLEFIL